MSVIKANKHQVGSNVDTSKNIVLEANADGDLVISKGVHDGTLTEIAKIKNAGGMEYVPAGTGAVATTVQAKLRAISVDALDFMTEAQRSNVLGNTGTIDVSGAVQAAVDSLPATGGVVDLPAGKLLFSAGVKTRGNVAIRGKGDATQILVNTDIEVFNSDTTTASSAIFGARFEDFYINKTVSTATTKYDIHLQNPNFCNITRVHIQSGHGDTQYSNTNLGGIFLDRPAGSTVSAFCNRVDDCWIQNNSIYCRNITDSVINGGFVWGHTRQFAIRIQGGVGGIVSGAIAIENVVGIIPSKYEGGIWLDGASLNQIRIHANEFDGNPALDTGYGILCLQQAMAVTITGNTFWGCDYHGIWAKDPVSWTITGNNFYKGGAKDDLLYGYDDIRIEASAISPNRNVISSNSHIIDDTRTNPGFAVRTISNGSLIPTDNSIVGNSVYGSYQGTGFYLVGSDQVQGNAGVTPMENRVASGRTIYGNTKTQERDFSGITASINELIPSSGTLDLALNKSSFLDTFPGGFVGHLYVTATRYNYAAQSRRAVYTVLGYGTTVTITQVAVQDGSGGGSSFALTTPIAGVIRLTDTSGSGSEIAASMTFHGTLSLA